MSDRPRQSAARRAPAAVVGALAAAAALLVAAPAQAISGATPTTAFESVGPGVQISADWVLTVRHAVLNQDDLYANGWGTREVAARYDAPGSGTFPAHDLSLMRLKPLNDPAPSPVPWMPVLGTAIPEGQFPPIEVTIVSAANSGPARGSALSTVTESVLQIDPDGPDPLGPVTVNWLLSWDTQHFVQPGDSGGALFAGHLSDSGLLLGLSSAQLQDDVTLDPLGSAFVQPAAYRGWIDFVMAQDLADDQTVNWVASVPEPATLLLWPAGALLLAAAARHRQRGRPGCRA